MQIIEGEMLTTTKATNPIKIFAKYEICAKIKSHFRKLHEWVKVVLIIWCFVSIASPPGGATQEGPSKTGSVKKDSTRCLVSAVRE